MLHRLNFILCPDFSNLSLSTAIEALFMANWLAQKPVFEWSLFSINGTSVRASNGVVVRVDGALPSVDKSTTVLIFASFNVKQHSADSRLKQWLRRTARQGAEIGGIETGSEILAAAGLLDGHLAAVHWDNLHGFQERYPAAKAEAILFTLNKRRLTCAGATCTMDFMLQWMNNKGYRDLAQEISQHLLLNLIRAGEAPQISVDSSASPASAKIDTPTIRKAVAIMSSAIEDPYSCSAIAKSVGLSQRQLQRHFRIHLNTTLKQEYMRIRLDRAHQLLQQTDLTVTEIAVCSGFPSLENFSRVYRREFGCAPSTDRTQSTSAPVLRRKGILRLVRQKHLTRQRSG